MITKSEFFAQAMIHAPPVPDSYQPRDVTTVQTASDGTQRVVRGVTPQARQAQWAFSHASALYTEYLRLAK